MAATLLVLVALSRQAVANDDDFVRVALAAPAAVARPSAVIRAAPG